MAISPAGSRQALFYVNACGPITFSNKGSIVGRVQSIAPAALNIYYLAKSIVIANRVQPRQWLIGELSNSV